MLIGVLKVTGITAPEGVLGGFHNGRPRTLGLSHDEGLCQVYVEDSGPTLDTRQMEEDLSPVHVIGAHRTHLNLAIAKRIVDEHGGRFDIGRSHYDGLKVKIRLPVDRRVARQLDSK